MSNNAFLEYQKIANLCAQDMTDRTFHLHQQFSDFDEFCANALNWDLDYRQLESGPFTSEILTFGNENTIFSRGKLGRRMLQRGSSPQGLVTFGLLADPKINIYWRNIDVTGDQLFLFPPGGELYSISHADFDVFVISLSEDKLDQVCALYELPEFHKLTRQHEAFKCEPQMLSEFRKFLLLCEREFISGFHAIEHDLHSKQLENELAESLIKLIANSYQPVSRNTPRKRDLALQSAESYLIESGNKVVTITELCHASNVSQRTLEYAFRERYGLTPKEYTLIYRLNNVRKQLCQCSPNTTLVSEIAQQHGFWHMGQFSSSYKKLFAELPSKTLKATG